MALWLDIYRGYNLAHLLTGARLFLTPCFLYVLATAQHQPTPLSIGLLIAVFLLVCASDYYDGPLARRLGLDSEAGKIFDNLADITFLLVTLSYLVHCGIMPWWIPAAIALAFAQYSLDSWLLSGKGTNVALVSNVMGHWAGILNYLLTGVAALYTVLQDHFLPALLYRGLLLFWLMYLLLAMAERLRFFLHARQADH